MKIEKKIKRYTNGVKNSNNTIDKQYYLHKLNNIKKDTFEALEELVIENENEVVGFSTKVLIISEMRSFEKYQRVKLENKQKLFDYIYSYWMENDLIENTLSDVVWLIFEQSTIVEDIETMDFKEFEKTLNRLV